MQSTNETYSERLARLKRMDVVAKQKLREMARRRSLLGIIQVH